MIAAMHMSMPLTIAVGPQLQPARPADYSDINLPC